MKENDFLDGISNIEADVVERFVNMDNKLQKKTKKPWYRYGLIAASLIIIISSGVIISRLRKNDSNNITSNNKEDRYKDFNIMSGENGLVWPWEYKTIWEKYVSIDINGSEYSGRGRQVSESYIDQKLGAYTATGYDDIEGGIYQEEFDVYAIKGVSSDKLIAVNMENEYYVFITEQYSLPLTWGNVLDDYSLAMYVKLDRFSYGNNYYILDNDEYIWDILKECRSNESIKPSLEWRDNMGDYISFTITSEALGVYKRAMYITKSGYIWTNAFDGEYLYFIGEDNAGKIIEYVSENSNEAEYEPYNNYIVGKITEITEEYLLVDDSILCNNPDEGITYKILINDIRISRYVENNIIKEGQIILVNYEGEIDYDNSNIINNATGFSEVIIYGEEMLIPE